MPSPLRVSALACVLTTVMLAGIAAGGFGAGEAIERSYGRVFEALDEAQLARGPVNSGVDPAFIHLSRLPAAVPATPVLSVGDVITLGARGGPSVAYDVVDVRPLGALGQGYSAGASGTPRLMMVTAVAGGQPVSQTIRFIVDGDNPGDTLPVLQPRAL